MCENLTRSVSAKREYVERFACPVDLLHAGRTKRHAGRRQTDHAPRSFAQKALHVRRGHMPFDDEAGDFGRMA